MSKLRGLIANGNFFVCCLLAFLFVFENSFTTPAWLQVLGRMHPLLLHFPIALLAVYALLVFFNKKPDESATDESLTADDLLLVGSFTAALSALMGLLLSKEGGYAEGSLTWHKWGGALIAFCSYGWYVFRKSWNLQPMLSKVVPVGMLVLITFAGHQGANITHGENFVLAPITPDASFEDVPFAEAVIYDHMVQPILKEKCMGCHNSRKAKGELVMESPETILAGGKNGLLWDSLNYEASLLLKRIHLPESVEEHMPPEGKNQLTDEEKEVLEAWIAAGAPFEALAAETAPNQPLYQIAQAKFNATKSYDFEAADPALVESLNSNYRIISPIALNSPALTVSFFSSEAFEPAQLKELDKIRTQVVELSLNKIPVKDEDLALLAAFENLEKLHLNFTNVSDKGLSSLAKLSNLRELSLSGTAVTAAGVSELRPLSTLQKIFIWNTGIDAGQVAELKEVFPNVSFESGFDDKGAVIQLSAPVIVGNEAFFTDPISVKLKHYLNGVTLRYTLDGSAPDSISSPIYEDGIPLDGNATINVKAFKDGWYSSEMVSKSFLRSSITPGNVSLLTQPNPKYKGKLEQTLFDHIKGTNIHTDGNWLGYQGEPMDVQIILGEEIPQKSITVSCLNNTGGWIMPPASIDIWYGDDEKNLKLWKKNKVDQPTKNLPVGPAFYTFDLPKEKYKMLKIHIMPVTKLPAWHDAKGNPGWVFVDEVLLN
ncbi:chitobiase/beta-hexosaminidase C-terminal domain-containing protein [uncultured Imperialibacter sp.]|uniref:chitobiase/beta-hexosaminidase C-terminal domain-containing protein n=1 Tax=uncultured Imperialibacter sp. TaxID=1672639 RepID=UPI0030DB40E5|tara:strand:+ start:60326 stop:62467 length:2142 start_codon:yes stop_codon:yes gene_type:complete